MSDEARGFYVYSISDRQGVVRHVAVGRPGQTSPLITRRLSVARLIDGAEPVVIKSGLTEREASRPCAGTARPLPDSAPLLAPRRIATPRQNSGS